MSTLIVGANGATGRLLVEELLKRGQTVKIVVRSLDSLPEKLKGHANLSVIEESILDMSNADMVTLVRGCHAVVSCLGHNLTFRGIYGRPRRLVTDATGRLCNAIRKNEPTEPIKFILMNTTGNRNHDLDERISIGQKCVIGLLRLLLPPHVDNEKAAVRPDGLIDDAEVTNYKIFKSPTRSAIFDSGVTSRINVAFFMAELINTKKTWDMWKGKMPVIYNSLSS
jgi:NAD(P)-dependent dehydrogenase (short-subunit alcohol dehydrogenase family)